MKKLYYLGALLFLFVACKKAIVPPNMTINVHGRFLDSLTDEPIKKIKIKIRETRNNKFDNYYLDSALTDNNGYYNIRFVTTGKGRHYFVDFSDASNIFINESKNGVNSYGPKFKELKELKNDLLLDMNLIKTYYLKTHIVVNNNKYSKLYIRTNSEKWALWQSGDGLRGVNVDTVLNIPFYKSNKEKIKLIFYVLETELKGYTSDDFFITQPVTRDTIDGGTYNLYPENFKNFK